MEQTHTTEEVLKIIGPGTEKVLIAPWNGVPIPVTIVMLSSVALQSCGDFTTVYTENPNAEKPISKVPDIEAMLKIKNIHENILRLCLVRPTFKEFHDELLGKDFVSQRQSELAEIRKLIDELDDGDKRQQYIEQADRLEIMLSFLLPEDFMTFVVEYIMQRDKSDIDKLTHDMLLRAGFLGEKYNKRPSDYLEGAFTEKQRIDIDVAALNYVADYRKMQGMEKENSGMRWIRGGKKLNG